MKLIKRQLESFRYAWNGIKMLVITQVNARIQLTLTIIVTILGFIFSITSYEWLALLMSMAVVWSAEALNTAIEWIVDKISPKYEIYAGLIKDIAAGAALLASFFAFIVGLVIFIPEILECF